jgi:hypothetical protein
VTSGEYRVPSARERAAEFQKTKLFASCFKSRFLAPIENIGRRNDDAGGEPVVADGDAGHAGCFMLAPFRAGESPRRKLRAEATTLRLAARGPAELFLNLRAGVPVRQ